MSVKIVDLVPDMNEVNIKVRVVETTEPREIQTFRGPTSLSEATVGDDSGRVTLTMWGEHAGKISTGQVIQITNGYTRVFRDEIRLNVGGRGSLSEIEDTDVPKEDEIPEITPEVPEGYRPRRRRGFRRRY